MQNEEIYFSKVQFTESIYGAVHSSQRIILFNLETKELSIQILEHNDKLVFSEGIVLDENQMKHILPYCNALDFEPFRGRVMKMDDPGFAGYRDESKMYFTGITNSYIPEIELPMNYIYSGKYEWPSERLYRHLVNDIILREPKLKGAVHIC